MQKKITDNTVFLVIRRTIQMTAKVVRAWLRLFAGFVSGITVFLM
jgi:hypothetical protein